jgi:phthalate 4,5-cis-dihydrodiol dehydrogenase
MAEILRLGIAGLGVATTQIFPFLAEYPNIKVTAAADIRPDALEVFKQRFGGRAYSSVEEMCTCPEVDVVYVCTPNHLHCPHVIAAAENKKHVIVEKPMALTMEECERMNAAAERNGVHILCGHTHSFDPPIRAMSEIVNSGKYGRLMMIHCWDYTDFMYRPRMAHELDTKRGGGVVFVQGPHHVDIVRQIAMRPLRRVSGATGIWDPSRPTEGNYTAFLEFEDGASATVVYNGYGHFDTAELHWWVGEGGEPRDPETNFKVRRNLRAVQDEAGLKESMRFAGAREGGFAHGAGEKIVRRQQFFGLVLVSCEKADIRQSPDGLLIYDDEGKHEVDLPRGASSRAAELNEIYEAVVHGKPIFHNGRWGQATLEVCLAIYQSARDHRDVMLKYQQLPRH